MSVKIADREWPQSDIPAGSTVRKIIYFGSVRDSDIQLHASAENGPITLADGYVPIGSPSEVYFEITEPTP